MIENKDVMMLNKINEVGAKVENVAKNSTAQDILTKLGTSGDSGSSTIFGKLNGMGVVKSVQRGAAAMSDTRMVVSINAVDMAKSFVNIQGGLVEFSSDNLQVPKWICYGNAQCQPNAGRLLSQTQLEVVSSMKSGKYDVYCIFWEVVEFY